MASTYLSRTFTSNSVSNRKFTYSFWIKRSALGECTMTSAYSDSTYFAGIKFLSDDRFEVYDYRGSYKLQKITSRKFRDINAWYHIVIASDTSVGTPDTKIYINGVEETAFDTDTDYTQNHSTSFNHSYNNTIGAFGGSSVQQYVNGIMSHFHFCDGYTYQASDFGSTDATTGEWKINTSPSVSYGSNGFFILKDGNSVTDQSNNTNNWTVGGGTLTKTEDCPDNVFCTLNEFDAYLNYSTLSNGNNTLTGGSQSVNYSMIRGTIGDTSGKYYWEVKAVDNAEIDQVGVMTTDLYVTAHASSGGLQATSWGGRGVQFSNGYKVANNSGSAYMGGFGANDILMVALDLDNSKITFGRNGQWSNGSGGADQTYANSTAAYSDLDSTKFYLPAHCQRDSAGNNSGTSQYNFGNGYFGTTAVASAGTNASGIGIFEYDVPSGFTALSTKGLNE